MDTIFTLKDLPSLLKKVNFKKLVIAGGCFDLLHLGHIIFLKKAASKGEVLVVLVESDQTIQKLKGKKRPIHTQIVRAEILSELKSVNYVLLLPPMSSDAEYDDLITKLNPSVIATTEGDEYAFHKKRQAAKIKAKLIFVTEQIKDHSTSKIIKTIKSRK